MSEFELEVCFANADEADRWIAKFVKRHGLMLVSRGTLRKYPGCIHWHLTKPEQSGTLEPTWWPKSGRFWLKVAANRNAQWIEEVLKAL